jgi:acyl phosphate:glycerol-3-phosphate acyltransferase
MMKTCLVILASYLLGCFTTGYYLVRLLAGEDIRTISSGNVGSRNVGRLLGTKGFLLTFAGDAGKGLLAVWLARQVSPDLWLAEVALVAVTAGHIWPVQLHFRGGKGFATFTGGMLLLQPLVLGMGLVICALLFPFFRRTTKTGLAALACSPLFMALVNFLGGEKFRPKEFSLYCIQVAIVLYAHRSNIRREFGRNLTAGE